MEKQIEAMTQQYTSELSNRQLSHDEAISKLRKDAEIVNAEMAASLASHDESRRQLKMKADQALFELSRIRDESQMQRNNDAKQIADLTQTKANLEEAINELEVSKVDWMKRNGELEQRYSRKMNGPPPQGPPPNMPLPPTPHPPMPRMRERGSGSDYSGGERSESLNHVQDIGAAVPLLPAHIGHMVQQVMVERDRVAAEAESLRKQLEMKFATAQEAVSPHFE